MSGNTRTGGRSFAPSAWPRLTSVLPPRAGTLPGGGVLRRLAGPALLLALWEVATALSGVDPELLPGPYDVALAARELIGSGELLANLWVSLLRVAQGLAIGVAAGTVVALAAGLQRGAGEVLDSTVQVLKAIPVFALLPLFIVWTGIGEAPKIALIAVTAALPAYINIFSAIRDVDAELMDVARCLRLSRLSIVFDILLPASASGFLSGLRIALTSAWLALIFAETINAKAGLGHLMSDAQMAFRMDIIMLVVAIYAVLGLAGYGVVLTLETVLLPWRRGFGGL